MPAVPPISQPRAIAAGLKHKSAVMVLAALGLTALVRLTGGAPGGDPARDLRQPVRFARTLLRQPPAMRVSAAALEGFSGDACVMALGARGKLSIGSAGLPRNTNVSLAACDLYNSSREAQSTELLGAASLSARNIFLSGGYALSAGSVMAASKHLATHTSSPTDPYARLQVPFYSGCTRIRYRLDGQKAETISPGVYCGGIEVAGGATLDLEPGTYILDRGNFTVDGNSAVSGTGVTLILTSLTRANYGAIDIRAGSTIEVTAPPLGAATGIPGVALWADGYAPANRDSFDGGSNQNINGSIYLPRRQVKYSGGSPAGTHCSQLIAQAVMFTGNSYFRHNCAGMGLSDPDPRALLAE